MMMMMYKANIITTNYTNNTSYYCNYPFSGFVLGFGYHHYSPNNNSLLTINLNHNHNHLTNINHRRQHRRSRRRWQRRTSVVTSSTLNNNNNNNKSYEVEEERDDDETKPTQTATAITPVSGSGGGIQLYQDIERLLMDTVKQSQSAFGGGSSNWTEVEGAWVLKPKNSKPVSVVHFVGGIFVGAAPQLTYRLFLERLADKGILVIATPYSSGFDHFLIADEVQFKFDRCRRFLQEPIQYLPTFGIGHSLGALIHLLIGSRYAVERKGNVLMAFNNKDASVALPIFSPVVVPMAQSMGPFLSQIISSPTLRMGAEMTKKQLENLSPAIMKQVLPLVEQLPPLYMDLANGRDNFTPKPEETKRIIKSYYGVSKNLLVKFKDDTIDETSALAQVLSDSAISSMLDMSIRSLPGDHGLPLQQALPDVPPAMADAVTRGGEFLANLTIGTPWESVAKDMSNTLGMDGKILRAEISKDVDMLVDVITSWMDINEGSKLLKS